MSEDLRTERKGMLLAVKDLPTLPRVLEQVAKLLEDPLSSTEQVAKLISRDQVLSAKVLKMVNSPVYGFPGRISTIQHGLVLLGYNVIKGLIISTSVFELMTTSMSGLWEHSVGCAMACGVIAREAGFKEPEEYAVAGLLHDLGKVIVSLQLPEAKEEVEQAVAEGDLFYLEAEKKVLGFGHDRVNSWVADHWNLPLNLKVGISGHHRPVSAQHYPKMACVVHVGDFLTRVLEIGSGGEDHVPALDPQALELLGLDLSRLDIVLDAMVAEMEDDGLSMGLG
ncbi:MAG TPA: HDOD domain-containing protein [Desulfonatronum sp.]|nr:HDOD domain-containing protein [Desulfonatronum sp.]